MSAYQTWDLTAGAGLVQDVLSGLSLDSRRFRQDAMMQYKDVASGVELDTVTVDTRNEQNVTAAFVGVTDVMAQMNESANANMYISKALKKEGKRLAHLNRDTKKGIYKVRQEFMYYAYMTDYYKFLTGVILYTLVVTLLLLMLTAAWRMGKLWDKLYVIMSVILLTIYSVSMVLMFKTAAYRRKYQWNKYYWRPSSEVKGAVMASSLMNPSGDSCGA
jgi:hypothetical protein